MTHICVSKLTITGSDNGLSPRHCLNQWWNIANWALGNKFQWNPNRNLYISTQENALENVVWKMAANLSGPQCVNWLVANDTLWQQLGYETVTFMTLTPSRFWFETITFKLILLTDGCDISSEIVLRRTSLDLSDDKSTLVQVMAWCRQATSH